MKIRLGYVAVPITLENTTYCKTMTYTHYEQLENQIRNEKLDNLILQNFCELKSILKYNAVNEIYFYRLCHNMIPLSTHEKVDFEYVHRYQKEWKEIGKIINENHFRVDTHPDQFCLLNSIKENVTENSLRILKFHVDMYEAMGVDGKMILHIGGGVLDKTAALERFKVTFNNLDKAIKDRIILENDDRIFTAEDTLNICEELQIPMVFDYHHYVCHHGKEKIEKLLPRIFRTWLKTNMVPKIHFSSPRNAKAKRTHSDFVNVQGFLKLIDLLKKEDHDVDIMLEVKAKDDALFRLVRALKFYTDYEFINNSTFIVKKDKK